MVNHRVPLTSDEKSQEKYGFNMYDGYDGEEPQIVDCKICEEPYHPEGGDRGICQDCEEIDRHIANKEDSKMGEIADAMLEGVFCEHCGEYLGEDAPGYPRLCVACQEDNIECVIHDRQDGPDCPRC